MNMYIRPHHCQYSLSLYQFNDASRHVIGVLDGTRSIVFPSSREKIQYVKSGKTWTQSVR